MPTKINSICQAYSPAAPREDRTPMLLVIMPALADDEEAKIKTAVEDRYKEWVAVANRKEAVAMANLYDGNGILMPQQEEPTFGKVAVAEYYKKLIANPNFVPFKLEVNLNSFQVGNDFAIATSLFNGEVVRGGKRIAFPAKSWSSRRLNI